MEKAIALEMKIEATLHATGKESTLNLAAAYLTFAFERHILHKSKKLLVAFVLYACFQKSTFRMQVNFTLVITAAVRALVSKAFTIKATGTATIIK